MAVIHPPLPPGSLHPSLSLSPLTCNPPTYKSGTPGYVTVTGQTESATLNIIIYLNYISFKSHYSIISAILLPHLSLPLSLPPSLPPVSGNSGANYIQYFLLLLVNVTVKAIYMSQLFISIVLISIIYPIRCLTNHNITLYTGILHRW